MNRPVTTQSSMETGDDEPGLHGEIARLARELHGPVRKRPTTPDQVLHDTAAAAVELLPAAEYAGITLVRRSAPKSAQGTAALESVAATDKVARVFDALQHELGQGPCFDAIWDHETVRVRDTTTERRWPELMTAVTRRTPVRSALSIQLFTSAEQIGALNLFSSVVDGFDGNSEDLAVNLATHAAIALSGARRGEQFQSALASRDIIGQAKGVVMERFDIDADQAFGLINRLSQDTNVRVVEIAQQLIAKEHPPRGEVATTD